MKRFFCNEQNDGKSQNKNYLHWALYKYTAPDIQSCGIRQKKLSIEIDKFYILLSKTDNQDDAINNDKG